MQRAELQPSTVYRVEYTGRGSAQGRYRFWAYLATGETVETETKARPGYRSSGTDTLVIMHPVDVMSDPYMDNDELAPTVTTWASPRGAHPRAISAPVCALEDWPKHLAELVAQRMEREALTETERLRRQDNITSAVAGLMAGGFEILPHGPWHDTLRKIARLPAGQRAIICHALLCFGTNTPERDPEAGNACARKYLDLAPPVVEALHL